MHWFFSDKITRDTITLAEEEARHCAQALRMRAGDPIVVMDGKGHRYQAELIAVRKKEVVARVLHSDFSPARADYRLEIAIAPTKNIARLEWFLEKATEIGIDVVTPVVCDHSERDRIRLDRLQRILLAATKQSQRWYIPRINELTPLNEVLTSRIQQAWCGIAHCADGEKVHLADTCPANRDVVVLIGPEGDFSGTEIKAAIDAGWHQVHLGPHRLRTETAALVATHIINLMNRDI